MVRTARPELDDTVTSGDQACPPHVVFYPRVVDPVAALWLSLGFVLVGTAVMGLLLREPLRRVQAFGRPLAWPTIIVGLALLAVGYPTHTVIADIAGWVVLYFGLVFKSSPGRRWFGR